MCAAFPIVVACVPDYEFEPDEEFYGKTGVACVAPDCLGCDSCVTECVCGGAEASACQNVCQGTSGGTGGASGGFGGAVGSGGVGGTGGGAFGGTGGGAFGGTGGSGTTGGSGGTLGLGGSGGSSGSAGSGGVVPPGCMNPVGECEACACERCAPETTACMADTGCIAIRDCARSARCTGFDCYCGDLPMCNVPGPCQQVIIDNGGADGPPATLALALGDCVNRESCPCSGPAPP